ncbi:IMP dehydrogenase [Escherichia coli]
MPRQYLLTTLVENMPMLGLAKKEALTFDDVLLVPAHSTVLPNTADLRRRADETIPSEYPYAFCSNGYRNGSTPWLLLWLRKAVSALSTNISHEHQAEEVRRVKKHESGVVTESATVAANHDAARSERS